jgi:hypothetical protein
VTMNNRELPLDDLVEQLRKAGSAWFRNSDLLLLEELIRRAKESERCIFPYCEETK